MPIFNLNSDILFPPVEFAEENGILAVGGDLSIERLIEAYRQGIFPWYSEGEPIIWWSPDPRFVLFPEELRISRSMKKILKRKVFNITFDKNFVEVIKGCQEPRKDYSGTWITDEMLQSYVGLHKMGLAHSVEAWQDDQLVGGLYGISLGRCFFGESMFARVSDASKACFITLVNKLGELDFSLIDCQVYTEHLESLGAGYIPRFEFMTILKHSLKPEPLKGNWGELDEFK